MMMMWQACRWNSTKEGFRSGLIVIAAVVSCFNVSDLESADVRVSFASSARHDEVLEVVRGVAAPVRKTLTAHVAR